MPTTRSPRTDCIASVIIPAGLVKLMTHASGASAATRSATWTATGTVRRPYESPPGAGRLLPEEPEVEGDPLVGGAALEAADPDGAEDEVRPLDRLVEARS